MGKAKKRHLKKDLYRYVDGRLEKEERQAVQAHLDSCEQCQKQLSFVKEFNKVLAELPKEEFTSDEPCPDSWMLVSYEAGDVDEETARHLRAHLLFCDQCADEYYALRQGRLVELPTKPESLESLIRKSKEMDRIFDRDYYEVLHQLDMDEADEKQAMIIRRLQQKLQKGMQHFRKPRKSKK